MRQQRVRPPTAGPHFEMRGNGAHVQVHERQDVARRLEVVPPALRKDERATNLEQVVHVAQDARRLSTSRIGTVSYL